MKTRLWIPHGRADQRLGSPPPGPGVGGTDAIMEEGTSDAAERDDGILVLRADATGVRDLAVDVGRRVPDVSIQNRLGSSARVDLDEGIRRTVDWFRDQRKLSVAGRTE